MRLYSGPLSMFGAKAEMAAIEKKIDVDVQFVSFSLKALYEPKHPEVLRVNPKGEIPVLIDGEVEIFDSTQIFEYFESIHPSNPMWPEDPIGRADARLIELKSDEVFFPKAANLMPRRRRSLSEEELQRSKDSLVSFYDEMNERLSGGDFLTSTFSYADIAFYSALFFARFLGISEGNQHHHLKAWRARMAERPSVNTVMGRMRDFLRSHDIAAEL